MKLVRIFYQIIFEKYLSAQVDVCYDMVGWITSSIVQVDVSRDSGGLDVIW